MGSLKIWRILVFVSSNSELSYGREKQGTLLKNLKWKKQIQ